MRTAQQSAKTPGVPLFLKQRVTALANVTSVLNAGDIVIVYDHTPPYNLNSDGGIAWPPVSDEAKVCRDLVTTAFKEYLTRLNAKSSAKLQNPPQSKPIEAGDLGAASLQDYQSGMYPFKSGGAKLVYYWAAFGVVNISAAINKAVYVFKKQSGPLLDLLKAGDFGLDAINNVIAKGLYTSAYLAAVGRGLAYFTLHEFWHMTTPKRPDPHWLGEGNMIIEGSADASDMSRDDPALPLTLAPESIAAILQRYNDVWCTNLKNGGLNANQF